MLSITHSDGREEIHPLVNKLIFDRLLPFLKVPELKQSRLVCKTWNDFISQNLQQRSWVKIGYCGEPRFIEFLDYIGKREDGSVSPEGVFYQNYEFMGSGAVGNYEKLQEFIKKCGPTIKSLNMIDMVMNIDAFRSLISLPNLRLQDLRLESCTLYAIEGEQSKIVGIPNYNLKSFTCIAKDSSESENSNLNILPSIWSSFFMVFPYLQELNLINSCSETTESWLSACLERKLSGHPCYIRKLNIFGETLYSALLIEKSHWQKLNSLNLHLESLQIDIGLTVCESEWIKLLRGQGPTLQILKIWRGILADDVNAFPCGISFPRLRELEIPDSCIQNLQFINFTRRLEKLWIRQCDNDPLPRPTSILTSVENVNPLMTLREFRFDASLTSHDLGNVKLCFPNASKIKALNEEPQPPVGIREDRDNGDDDESIHYLLKKMRLNNC